MPLPDAPMRVSVSKEAARDGVNRLRLSPRHVIVWGFLFLLVLQPGAANNARQQAVADRLNQQPFHSAHPISAEEAFTNFASRVLFLSCDLGVDDAAFGSGVLVSSDGLVATNAHVVEGCQTMREKDGFRWLLTPKIHNYPINSGS
jgi:S1-C subfamily serine protease